VNYDIRHDDVNWFFDLPSKCYKDYI